MSRRPHSLTKEWTKEDIDEMLMELLGCEKQAACQLRARWMSTGKSPREELLALARELDADDGLSVE